MRLLSNVEYVEYMFVREKIREIIVLYRINCSWCGTGATLKNRDQRYAGMLFSLNRTVIGWRNNNNLSGFFPKKCFYLRQLESFYFSCSVNVIQSNSSAIANILQIAVSCHSTDQFQFTNLTFFSRWLSSVLLSAGNKKKTKPCKSKHWQGSSFTDCSSLKD